jgi:cysteine-rich repeat protein
VISDDNSSDRDVVAEPTVVNRCGDGVKTSGEECDDGAAMNGDGCSSVCRVERGYECMGDEGEQSWCRKLCGNLVRNPG